MTARHVLAIGALALHGCLAETDDFARRSARHACTRFEACDAEFFQGQYGGDRSECRDDVENNNRFTFDAQLAMGCTYEPSRARACINVARKDRKDCSADAQLRIANACQGVLDCSLSGATDPERPPD
ncbi:MAG: hypothetical protein AAF721_21665 [Myxococcota bacterium]